ncbi:MAG: hypothetical protein QME71_00485 [Dehalococcoidia bacterium]|nr:hypothetical protein [Dehalococcoidia bacterium]
MRVLSLGFALPNPSIDNYSFASAPSFFDYDALVVDPAALSRLIEEIADQAAEHASNAGEPLVNGATSPVAVGLADMLRRRQTETVRLLSKGGAIVCFAYPDVYHHRVVGFTGCDRYYWLPAPPGLQYREPHLLPGDGTSVIPTDHEHPFAAYIDAFRDRLAYRAYFSDAIPGFDGFGRVFARSAGGAAVGVELRVEAGRIVFLPPVAEPGRGAERHPLAETIVNCLRRLLALTAEESPPRWVRDHTLPGLPELEAERSAAQEALSGAYARLQETEARLSDVEKHRRLLWQEGKFGLETAVRDAFALLGFQVTKDIDEQGAVYMAGEKLLLEVEGSPEAVGMEPHYRLRRRLEQAIAETGRPQKGLIVVNGFRLAPPGERPPQYSDALRVAAESMHYCLLASTDLFAVVKRHLEGDASAAKSLRELLLLCEGALSLEDGSEVKPGETTEPEAPQPKHER